MVCVVAAQAAGLAGAVHVVLLRHCPNGQMQPGKSGCGLGYNRVAPAVVPSKRLSLLRQVVVADLGETGQFDVCLAWLATAAWQPLTRVLWKPDPRRVCHLRPHVQIYIIVSWAPAHIQNNLSYTLYRSGQNKKTTQVK